MPRIELKLVRYCHLFLSKFGTVCVFFSLGVTFIILHDLLKHKNPVFQFYESILSEKTDCVWIDSGQNIKRLIILI